MTKLGEMTLEMLDETSNQSDFSTDSQSSQTSSQGLRIDDTVASTVALLSSVNENSLALLPGTKMFITLEGLNSGVPTRTTPTLTPTTLKNIEQTFIELQSKPETHENEAGFVPPMVHSIGNNQYISASDANDMYSSQPRSPLTWYSSMSQSSSDSNMSCTPPLTQKTHLVNNTPQGKTRRNMGGRKPARDLNLSPEEEEKRRIRRERNKAAAARCRKRRVDLTNQLMKEVEELERKRNKLCDEHAELLQEKRTLEITLQHHKENDICRLATQSPPDIKPFEQDEYFEKVKTEEMESSLDTPTSDQIFLLPDSPVKKLMFSSAGPVPISRPNRPNSLNVTVSATKHNELLGLDMGTPSAGMGNMFNFINFDSMMSGGTGLTPGGNTPLVPSCSSQQRFLPVSIACELVSPDSCGPPKLVSL